MEVIEEPFRWIENLRLCSVKSLILPPPGLHIIVDASGKGWGTISQGKSTWGPWSREKQKTYTNILELKVVQLAILTFSKLKVVQRKHLQMDNRIALSYLIRMSGTHNKKPVNLSKEIWKYPQSKQIMITAYYLPNLL